MAWSTIPLQCNRSHRPTPQCFHLPRLNVSTFYTIFPVLDVFTSTKPLLTFMMITSKSLVLQPISIFDGQDAEKWILSVSWDLWAEAWKSWLWGVSRMCSEWMAPGHAFLITHVWIRAETSWHACACTHTHLHTDCTETSWSKSQKSLQPVQSMTLDTEQAPSKCLLRRK